MCILSIDLNIIDLDNNLIDDPDSIIHIKNF